MPTERPYVTVTFGLGWSKGNVYALCLCRCVITSFKFIQWKTNGKKNTTGDGEPQRQHRWNLFLFNDSHRDHRATKLRLVQLYAKDVPTINERVNRDDPAPHTDGRCMTRQRGYNQQNNHLTTISIDSISNDTMRQCHA